MRAKLLSIEIDMDDLEGSINILNASIEHAELSLDCLLDNIETLKRNKIIASLEQFRISTRQIAEARKKMAIMKNKRNTLKRKMAKKEKNRIYYEKKLNEALDDRDRARESGRVINISDFRRRK